MPKNVMIHEADDDAFLDRHFRKPREHDGFNRPCKDTDTATIGISSENRIDLSFTYEVNVESFVFNRVEENVIPAIESSISESLVREFDIKERCEEGSKRRLNARRLRQIQFVFQMRRRLELQGITSDPPDELADQLCDGAIVIDNSRCASVDGGMSFYVDDGTPSNDMETVGYRAIDFMKQNMEEGTYNDSYQGIQGIEFRTMNLFQVTVDGENLEINLSTGGEIPAELSVTPMIVAASVLVLMIMCIVLCVRRVRKLKPYIMVDDYSGTGNDFRSVDSYGTRDIPLEVNFTEDFSLMHLPDLSDSSIASNSISNSSGNDVNSARI